MRGVSRRVLRCVAAIAGVACDTPREHGPPTAEAVIACTPPPDTTPVRLPVAELRRWAGTYALTVVATQGFAGDSLVRGPLELWVPDAAHAAIRPNPNLPDHVITFPLAGATGLDLGVLGPLSLAHSPASQDRARPGVQMNQNGTLVIGNSIGSGGFTTDAGVYFETYAADREGLRGRWTDGGLAMVNGARPGGYFCAVRVHAPAT